MKKFILVLLLLGLLAIPSLSQAHRTRHVQFPAGAVGTTLVDGIARGETMTYLLGARAGQRMRIVCSSIESNATFDVIAPGIGPLEPSYAKDGRQVWYSVLPSSGEYHVVVGTTRGGAEVNISFEIW